MKCGVHGINGKMGKVIAQMMAQAEDLTLGAGFVRSGHPWAGQRLCDVWSESQEPLRLTSNLDGFCAASDIVIDFSRPDATLALLPVCRKYRKALLIGTTGFNDKALHWIREAAQDIPIVLAANTSVGVNILLEITRRVAAVLPPEVWHSDILDLHHAHKDDAPSGTALRLGEAIAQAQNTVFGERKVYPYNGRRRGDDIGYAVLRSGEIVGEHTVFFTAAKERLEFTHRAQSREIFAHGALVAARWLHQKTPGLYRMSDVLGLNV